MRAYRRFAIDDKTPVQFLGVNAHRWQPEWGEPTAMFREMEAQELMDVPEVRALVKALRRIQWSEGDGGWRFCPSCGHLTGAHASSCELATALTPFAEEGERCVNVGGCP